MDGGNKIAAGLEAALEKYDRIILIDDRNMTNRDRELREFFSRQAVQNEEKGKLLLLSVKHGGDDYNNIYGQDDSRTKWEFLTEKEIEDILALYHLYEFSNRFQVISANGCCGSLLDYVNTGILTLEEVVTVVLK